MSFSISNNYSFQQRPTGNTSMTPRKPQGTELNSKDLTNFGPPPNDDEGEFKFPQRPTGDTSMTPRKPQGKEIF